MSFNFIYNGVFQDLAVALLLYLLGYFTNELWDYINKERNEEKLRKNTALAMESIYEAENKINGKKMGSEKLDYSVKKYMQETKTKSYANAQEQIIKVFTLTKFSK